MDNKAIVDNILAFWFGEPNSPDYGEPKSFWWKSTPEIDRDIKDTYEGIYNKALAGELAGLMETPKGCLTLVLIFDQFPRNMFRGTKAVYETDEKALEISKAAIAKGFDMVLPIIECKFLYMPFMHSEKLEDQEEAVKLFDALGEESSIEYANDHRDIVARFGRFPHRNIILGRTSTPEEIDFLKEPGSSF
jgi:uncharacterized protein (DUF924 family)